jgi:hypothetical protein
MDVDALGVRREPYRTMDPNEQNKHTANGCKMQPRPRPAQETEPQLKRWADERATLVTMIETEVVPWRRDGLIIHLNQSDAT